MDTNLVRSSKSFLDKLVAKFLRELLWHKIPFTSSDDKNSLQPEMEQVGEGESVFEYALGGGLIWLDMESDVSESEGGIGVTDDNQLLTWVEFADEWTGKLVSDTFKSLLLLGSGVTVGDVIDDVEGVNPITVDCVAVSLDTNDAGMVVSGDIAFATIADTDFVNKSTLFFKLCKSFLSTLYFKLYKKEIL